MWEENVEHPSYVYFVLKKQKGALLTANTRIEWNEGTHFISTYELGMSLLQLAWLCAMTSKKYRVYPSGPEAFKICAGGVKREGVLSK